MLLGKPYTAFKKAVPDDQFPYAQFDGTGLVTTNGHYLIRVPVEPEDDDTPGPISREVLEAAYKSPEKRITANGSLKVGNTTFERPEMGRFPDVQPIYDQLPMPGDEDSVTIGLNVDYLKLIAEALGANSGDTKKRGQVFLTFRLRHDKTHDSRAIYIRAPATQDEAFAALMPVCVG